jgi:hypothetical protein
MSRIGLRRPSPALVIAVVALFMAMAGTGYAALKLPNDSVGAKQLKKDAVTGAKVKQGSLEGSDIKLSTLGPVPAAATAAKANSAETAVRATTAESAARADTATSADHAVTADSAASIPPAGPIHLVGAPGEPPFLSGSASTAFPIAGNTVYPRVGFFKDHEGVVHLEGVVTAGKEGTAPGLLFVLPPGYRPAADTVIPFEPAEKRGILIGGTGAQIGAVELSGGVYAPETEAGAIPLGGIAFLAQG